MLYDITFKFVFKAVLYLGLSILGVHIIAVLLYVCLYFIPYGLISHLLR